MLVVRADHMGMCFGVRDALDTMRRIPNPTEVTVHGELVHNPVVIGELARRGFHQQGEAEREVTPNTPEVLITAHGISNARRQELERMGKTLHDTTCPLVRRVHKSALHYHNKGYFLLVLGRHDHVEVQGLTGDLTSFAVVATVEEVTRWPALRLAVVNQTTFPPEKLARMHQAIRDANPHADIELVDTICRPTRDRQQAVESLLDRVEGLVVVGGPNSNNTLALGRRAEERSLPWWRVTDSSELRPEWFTGLHLVGLTAGTSTTDETVEEVARTLRSFSVEFPEPRYSWKNRRRPIPVLKKPLRRTGSTVR